MYSIRINHFKLPRAFLHFLIPLFLSCAMSSIVSAISLMQAQGIGNLPVSIWFSSWMLSWSIAFPSVLLLLPLARKLALRLVRAEN
ncbi:MULTISPECIES: DUF2798 domain-containing protein [Providencia]|uniref:DUF2798 domain-containing protein n=1 Tax=Providencia TaxID=586 RepID=UPI0008FB1B1D|nr:MULTISPECIES: DUF2798 domain-containing protein [Providencia]APC12864.1 hypothetical protein RB151_032060 [Providencia rettgeri]AVL72384.1 DUF2798 domain-containing protein [Providencia rettgeri]EKH6496150.1 DUF2798 domain-containing protein [Providencia rettgeri]ELR5053139.1 DUF2798 domain-containing protein [Providencia rettgeri]ELR5155373.1 DUF2798 domain-containing protein [Providencia rettgeri]